MFFFLSVLPWNWIRAALTSPLSGCAAVERFLVFPLLVLPFLVGI